MRWCAVAGLKAAPTCAEFFSQRIMSCYCFSYFHQDPSTNWPVSSVVKTLLSVQEVWGSNPGPVKPDTVCQWLATAAAFLGKCDSGAKPWI